MKTSDPSLGSPADLAQLKRLRQARVEAAERRVFAQRRVCDEARAAVEAQARRIEVERERLRRYALERVGAGAASLPRFQALDAAFGEDLHDNRDRAEYDLIDQQETLADEQAALRERQREWLREQARRDAVSDALVRSRAAVALGRERSVESEIEDTRRGVVSHPLARNP